jgi:hypothetical protein
MNNFVETWPVNNECTVTAITVIFKPPKCDHNELFKTCVRALDIVLVFRYNFSEFLNIFCAIFDNFKSFMKFFFFFFILYACISLQFYV